MLNKQLALKTKVMQREQNMFKRAVISLIACLLMAFIFVSHLAVSATSDALIVDSTRFHSDADEKNSDKTNELIETLQLVRMHNISRHRKEMIQPKTDKPEQRELSTIKSEIEEWEKRFAYLDY